MYFQKVSQPTRRFQSKTHIITPTNSHKDMWVFTDKKNPISQFCIIASTAYIENAYVPFEDGWNTKMPLVRPILARHEFRRTKF